MAHDSDPFNRWEAGQRLATRQLLALVESIQMGQLPSVDSYVLEAFRQVLRDETLDPAFRAQALTLPAESYLGEQMAEIDPAAIHAARQYLRQRLAASLHTEWLAAYHNHRVPGPYRPDAASAGERALKNLALSYLMELSDAGVAQTARTQYDEADNMTDRFAALTALVQRGGAARDGDAAHGPNHAAEALVEPASGEQAGQRRHDHQPAQRPDQGEVAAHRPLALAKPMLPPFALAAHAVGKRVLLVGHGTSSPRSWVGAKGPPGFSGRRRSGRK